MNRKDRNEAALSRLHPRFAEKVRLLLLRCEARGMKLCITDGYRSSEEQERLYTQGRTTPGLRVTNAPPWTSYHQYGLAIDVVDFASAGDPDTFDVEDYQATHYPEIESIAVAMGLEAGGMWHSGRDLPHFEWHPGFTKRDAEELRPYAEPDGSLPLTFFDAKGTA